MLADAPSGRGGAWGKDDVVLFPHHCTIAHLQHSCIRRYTGSSHRTAIAKEVAHRWPVFLR